MDKDTRTKTLKGLWGLRHVKVKDLITTLEAHPNLKWLLSAVGLGFFVREVIILWAGVNVLYIVYRIFQMALN